jgi:hypothetical protein
MVFLNHKQSLIDHQEDLNKDLQEDHLHQEQVHPEDHLPLLSNHPSKSQSLNNLVIYPHYITSNKVLLSIHNLGLLKLGVDPMDPHPLKLIDLLDLHPLKVVDLLDPQPLKLVDLQDPLHRM